MAIIVDRYNQPEGGQMFRNERILSEHLGTFNQNVAYMYSSHSNSGQGMAYAAPDEYFRRNGTTMSQALPPTPETDRPLGWFNGAFVVSKVDSLNRARILCSAFAQNMIVRFRLRGSGISLTNHDVSCTTAGWYHLVVTRTLPAGTRFYCDVQAAAINSAAASDGSARLWAFHISEARLDSADMP
jgi:hypothetical protein